jgi:maltooligosyltrehalose synthase
VKTPGTRRQRFALSLSIALAMSGVGMILPIVPSHVARLGLANTSTAQVALHVTLGSRRSHADGVSRVSLRRPSL